MIMIFRTHPRPRRLPRQSTRRLYGGVKPAKYALELEPDVEKGALRGRETLEFELAKAQRSLTFHAYGIQIKKVSVNGSQPIAVEFDEAERTVTFNFAEEVPAGEGVLKVDYQARITDSLHGVYRSRFVRRGAKHLLVATLFEEIHAREAFVCIDEPEAKAVFELSIVVARGLEAISNSPVQSVSELGGKDLVQFEPTPPMATYLVAFAVGTFEATEAVTAGGVKVRVCATPGNRDEMSYGLEVAVKTLDFFAEYFDIPYPIRKLDLVAVPDFASGAMENWGAVTFREADLLFDERHSSLANRQRVAEVVTHEMAHQWFGNLVTMRWWSDLWLKEGFASWAAMIALERLFPDWDARGQFICGHNAEALLLDSMLATHPVQVVVGDPAYLEEVFDSISYFKAAALIAMLQAFLGEQVFRQGVQAYLKKYQFKNANTADLWEMLEGASQKPVGALMKAWTGQPGYPLVSTTGRRLRQQRFTICGRESDGQWPVPVQTMVKGGPGRARLLEGRSCEWPGLGQGEEWEKLNAKQLGFYRVDYTASMLDALAPDMESKALPAIDRFGVVSDTFALAQSGRLATDVALRLVSSLRGEDDYLAWRAMTDGVRAVLGIIRDDEIYVEMEGFAAWLVKPAFDRLGWAPSRGERSTDTLLRSLLLELAVSTGDKDVRAEAMRRFEARATKPVAPDLQPAVYLAAALEDRGYAEVRKAYLDTQQPHEKMRLLMALSEYPSKAHVKRTLALALSSEVRPQDTVNLFAWAMRNRENRQEVWAFIQQSWQTLVARYGEAGLEQFPAMLGASFNSAEDARAIAGFFEHHASGEVLRPARRAVEQIKSKAEWYDRDRDRIGQFLGMVRLI
jgi:puromycin-sensitive aminopeptidase